MFLLTAGLVANPCQAPPAPWSSVRLRLPTAGPRRGPCVTAGLFVTPPKKAAMARILVLEDDEYLRGVLARVLQESGYEVETASRGEEAVARASVAAFDLVVADVRMEGMDGLEALARVKQQQPDVSGLVVTGYASEADSIRAIRLGVGDYLKKPFGISAFLDSVRNVIGRGSERRAAQRQKALDRLLLWAAETVAGSAELSSDDSARLVPTARRVFRLAEAAGMEEQAAQNLQVACLLWLVRRSCPEFKLPDLVLRALPAEAEAILAGMESEQAPARLALAAALAEPGADRSSLDPVWRQALERLEARSGNGDVALPARRRSLLALARALWTAGDQESSASAYTEVLQSPGTSRHHGEALVGMARIAASRGQADQAREAALQVAQSAPQLGPSASAQLQLEAAMVLAQVGASEAVPLLEQANRLAETLSLDSVAARARLALAWQRREAYSSELETSLGRLLRAEHLELLTELSPWLPAYLLGLPQARPALEQLAQASPRVLMRALPALAPPARERALELLKHSPDPGVQETLARQGARAAPKSDLKPPLTRFFSLGGFEVYKGDERLDERSFKSQKVRYLLALLAANGDRFVSEDVVLEAFWPEDPARGRRSLNVSTSLLRTYLKPAGWPGELNYVVRSSAGLRLNPDLPRWHDLEELEKALDAGQDRRAVELYRGTYLEGCYMDWALAIRHRLERRLTQALLRLAQAQVKSNPAEAVEHAERLLELDPCSQDGFLALMGALMALGKPEEAVRQFKLCAQRLREELAMEPSIALLEAHQRALLSLS